ncbi:MAG: c-type cytochrome [Candidatus Xenobia bacterium]
MPDRGGGGSLLALRRHRLDRDLHGRLSLGVHRLTGGLQEGKREKNQGARLSTYVSIAIYLAILTGLELAAATGHGPPGLLRWVLLIFGTAKFAAVVLVYMHLYWDRRLLLGIFGGGLLMAALTLGTVPSLIPAPPPRQVVRHGRLRPGRASEGPRLVHKFGCVNCHAIPGVSAPAEALCPNLAGLADRAGSREPGFTAKAYIRESIEAPEAYIVPGYLNVMPHLRSKMTDQQFADIVAYLMTLHKHDSGAH